MAVLDVTRFSEAEIIVA